MNPLGWQGRPPSNMGIFPRPRPNVSPHQLPFGRPRPNVRPGMPPGPRVGPSVGIIRPNQLNHVSSSLNIRPRQAPLGPPRPSPQAQGPGAYMFGQNIPARLSGSQAAGQWPKQAPTPGSFRTIVHQNSNYTERKTYTQINSRPRDVSSSPAKGSSQTFKHVKCDLCNVTSSNEQLHAIHLTSNQHKMEERIKQRREEEKKRQEEEKNRKEEQKKETEEDEKRKQSDDLEKFYCDVCNFQCKNEQSYKVHRSSITHQQAAARPKPASQESTTAKPIESTTAKPIESTSTKRPAEDPIVLEDEVPAKKPAIEDGCNMCDTVSNDHQLTDDVIVAESELQELDMYPAPETESLPEKGMAEEKSGEPPWTDTPAAHSEEHLELLRAKIEKNQAQKRLAELQMEKEALLIEKLQLELHKLRREEEESERKEEEESERNEEEEN